MILTIDRFEGDYAVCEKENREMIDILRTKLPEGVKEGDVLKIDNGEFTLQPELKKERDERISGLMDDLWED